jgi:hypothetical protein
MKIIAALLIFLSSSVAATDIPVDGWLRTFQTRAPVAFCAKTTILRACYDLTAEDCELSIASATRTCILSIRNRLPTTIRVPEDGTKFGSELGSCIEDAYVAANSNRILDNAACTTAKAEEEKLQRSTK